MNIRIGSNRFENVEIPILWGKRAILQDAEGRLSVVDLGADRARLEVLGDGPAPGVAFRPVPDGFVITHEGLDLYSFNRVRKSFTSLSLGLPDVKLGRDAIAVGTNRYISGVVAGYGVGIAITDSSVAFGAPLPDGIARLEL